MEAVFIKCAKPAIYHELQQCLQPFVYWHVTESVQEGYNPEAIGELQEEVEVEALVLERGSTARDHALGYFISLFHHYLARQSGAANIDAAIDALHADLDKETPVAPFNDFHLDTADIYAYIEEERQNAGIIADDPDWHQRPKVTASQQWNALFKKSLEQTRVAYVQACERFEHRFKLGSEADLELVQLLPDDKLADLASEFRAKPRHVPAPPSAPAGKESFWAKRIGSEHTATSKHVPEFEPAHLVQAGQQFRSACIDAVRAHTATSHAAPSGKDVDVILSQALNLETNPTKLVERASQQWTSCTPKSASPDEEAIIRRAKDSLSSALRILARRDGQRNIDLRIDALNLRGHINRRLAELKPQHEANYLSRAVTDWSASAELDAGQRDIIEVLAETELRMESFAKSIAASEDREMSVDNGTPDRGKQPASPVSPQASGKPTSPRKSKAERASCSSVASTTPSDATTTSPPAKTREPTILSSPFFRTDLVTGLMVDTLLALSFPHRAFRETLRLPSAASLAAAAQDHVPMLERLARAHQQTTKSLTPENKAQLTEAVKAVSAVLALPDVQGGAGAEGLLRRTSLRLVLGTMWLLQGSTVKAGTELGLVSDALRPDTRAKAGKGKAKFTPNAEAGGEQVSDGAAIRQMQSRVQGTALFLLAKTCWLANKVQEAIKFFRWFVKWYSEQQAERVADARERVADARERESDIDSGLGEGEEATTIELEELDMAWWDKVVVVTKT
ncbi:hypothetical protein PSEUBRA_002396 [Kalmanozyma brasiliensis GHG001]|uniref:Uncharacterized protein n=1 Tax=Kalmanozyma brasiliensis (strain GHG001) TaxID=1365824 RepID=V5EYV5_KALBG|nr:uncharacterized protein PSEUBRA_002396 [Kalmanozyma brasiliensis GHG001]EST08004.1 hypothetical protein PSEUBRA_002396 [Kalmanozyma brasiliensis GHG001]